MFRTSCATGRLAQMRMWRSPVSTVTTDGSASRNGDSRPMSPRIIPVEISFSCSSHGNWMCVLEIVNWRIINKIASEIRFTRYYEFGPLKLLYYNYRVTTETKLWKSERKRQLKGFFHVIDFHQLARKEINCWSYFIFSILIHVRFLMFYCFHLIFFHRLYTKFAKG